jgi:hypothetical protein
MISPCEHTVTRAFLFFKGAEKGKKGGIYRNYIADKDSINSLVCS